MPVENIRIRYDIDRSEINAADKALEGLTQQEKELIQQFRTANRDAKQSFDKVEKGAKDAAKATDKTGKSFNNFGGVATKVGGIIAGVFAVDRILEFSKNIVRTTGEFQRFAAVLTNTLGSESSAQLALNRIQSFAAETPFSVSQLTDSFVKLANQGFEPTSEELRKLGDLAASTGKDFNQLTEAVIDAQVGEFERLKEFGIRAQKQGDQVTFTFKGVQEQVDFTSESIQEYLLSLGEIEGVSGAMDKISNTLEGRISNLGDSFDRLSVSIGNSNGWVAQAISMTSALVGNIADLIEGIDKVAERNVAEEVSKEVLAIEADLASLVEGLRADGKTTQEIEKALDAEKERIVDTYREKTSEARSELLAFFKKKKEEESMLDQFAEGLGFGDDDVEAQELKIREQMSRFEALAKAVEDIFENIDIEEDVEPQVGILTALREELKNLTESRDQALNVSDIEKYNQKITETKEAIDALVSPKKEDSQELTFEDQIEELNKLEDTALRVAKVQGASELDIFEIRKDFADQRTELARDAGDEETEALDEFLLQKRELEKEYFDWRKEETQETVRAEGEARKKETDELEEELQKRRELREQYADAAIGAFKDIANASFEIQSNNSERELNRLQQAKERELALVRENEQAKGFVEQKFAKEEARIKKQQAQREKDQALFNIAVNTAEAVVKAIAASPPTFGLPFSAFALASGAAQAAAVSSRPIPRFNKGTKSVPGVDKGDDSVMAMVRPGEGILPVDRNKKYGPSFAAMYDQTVPADEMNAFVMNYGKLNNRLDQRNPVGLDRTEKSLKSIEKTLSKIPITKVNIDKRGIRTFVEQGSSETELMNNLYKN